MAVLLGAIPGLNAKNLINMGIVRKEKNGNTISIVEEFGIYHVRGFKNGNHFWNSFERFSEAKAFFLKMYKSF
jgi:hypothetical protein